MSGASSNLLRHVQHLAEAHRIGSLSDRQLLKCFAKGHDEAAFALLVRRHGPMVHDTCRRVLGHEQDAEDVFQATFLILARKAGAIRQADVGGFLYRVAYHLAVRARGDAVKRRRREQRAEAPSAPDLMGEVTWREVRQVVDEELQRLPEAARSALVLCYLEGKTLEEAAHLLSWSKSTLRRRLDHGRELLRRRLLARGLPPMAALTASLFAEEAAAAMPATLLSATVREAVAGSVSPAVAALVEAGAAPVSVSKARVVMVLLLAVSLLSGAGVWMSRGMTAITPSQTAEPRPPAPPRSGEGSQSGLPPPLRFGEGVGGRGSPLTGSARTLEFQGRVLDPEDKPKAGARLLLLDMKGHLQQLGVTAADGRFRVRVAEHNARSRVYCWLVAQADGSALDFLELFRRKADLPVELRLAKDHPIRGRVVNTEGKPIRGVRVAVASIDVPSEASLDSYLNVWKQRSFGSSIGCEKRFVTEGASPLMTTTDAEGRFVLHGAGLERVVTLRFRGAGIAEEERCIINRPRFDPQPYNQVARDKISKGEVPYGTWFLHGPNVSIVAEPEKPIHGVVTDADSGKPLPGVRVLCSSQAAKTDTLGRYHIHGVAREKSYTIGVASDPATGYMASQVRSADTAGYQPIRADIRVKKGVIITGKVIDEATGKAVPGYAAAAILADNPFVKKYPQMSDYSLDGDREYTEGAAAFRVVALPGPVLLMVNIDYTQSTGDFTEAKKYADPIPDPKYPQYFARERDWPSYHAFSGGTAPVQGSFCKVLEIKPGTATVHQDAVLRRASFLTVKIEDAEGRPVRGAWATGIGTTGHSPVQILEASCSAYGVKAGTPRHMVFIHTERKIAGTLTLTGNENQPAVVQLRPMGSIKGRLLDRDGKPLAGVAVDLYYSDARAYFVHEALYGTGQVVTDADGAFALDNVVGELKFHLSFQRRKQRFERATKAADPDIQVKPGACRDLDAIKLKPLPEDADE
jgi:RNA polymerase sigma factor (sigma-70 family)